MIEKKLSASTVNVRLFVVRELTGKAQAPNLAEEIAPPQGNKDGELTHTILNCRSWPACTLTVFERSDFALGSSMQSTPWMITAKIEDDTCRVSFRRVES
jgi:hypothetical protein